VDGARELLRGIRADHEGGTARMPQNQSLRFVVDFPAAPGKLAVFFFGKVELGSRAELARPGR